MNLQKPSNGRSDISLILYVPGLTSLTVCVNAQSKIESLRRMLMEKLRENNFYLVHENFVLEDSSTISNYNLRDYSVIRVSSDLRENSGYVTDRLVLAANPDTRAEMFRLLDLEMVKLEQKLLYYKKFIVSDRVGKNGDSYSCVGFDQWDRDGPSRSSLPMFW